MGRSGTSLAREENHAANLGGSADGHAAQFPPKQPPKAWPPVPPAEPPI